jgi:hypothetical protein
LFSGAEALPNLAATIQFEWHAEVAQLVEQLIRNQQVIGSSPIFGSILRLISSATPRSRYLHALFVRVVPCFMVFSSDFHTRQRAPFSPRIKSATGYPLVFLLRR